MNNSGHILLYQAKNGQIAVEVTLEEDTIWLTQKQMAELFNKDVRTINEHIKTVYSEGELEEGPTIRKFRIVQKEGGRSVTRTIDGYNLDMIISVGYRVNSKEGTRFRIWATQVLRDHLVQGFTVNPSRYKDRLKEFEQAVALIKRTMQAKLLDTNETAELLTVITDYAHTWAWLQKYDDNTLSEPSRKAQPGYTLTYEEAIVAIAELKSNLMQKNLASRLFGSERGGDFEGIIGALYQTIGGKNCTPRLKPRQPICSILSSRTTRSRMATSVSARSSL